MGTNPVIKTYLLAYNALSCVGWAFVLYRTVMHFQNVAAKSPSASLKDVYNQGMGNYYDELGWYVRMVQTCAIAEILHSAIGIVRSPIMSTVLQVGSRLFLVWGISALSTASQVQCGYLLMVASWSLVEIPRYAYYAFALIGNPPGFLTWLRYTLFIVLYPSGITGEILTILAAMPYIKDNRPYTISMPNSLNFAFDYYYMCLLLLAFYVPGSPFMFNHMWRQRKKILATDQLKVKSH